MGNIWFDGYRIEHGLVERFMNPKMAYTSELQNGGKFTLSHKKGQWQTTDKSKNIMNHTPLVIPKTITRSERQDNIGPPFSFGTPHVGYGPFDPKMSIPAIYHESGRIQHNAIECPILVSPQIL